MSIDLSTQIGYGFYKEGERSNDLVKRLGLEGKYEIDGWPDTQLLPKLGYEGLSVLERHTMGGPGGWAICATSSLLYLYPKTDEGIWSMNQTLISSEEAVSLTTVRDRLFPSSSDGGEDQPEIGWFLISSIY